MSRVSFVLFAMVAVAVLWASPLWAANPAVTALEERLSKEIDGNALASDAVKTFAKQKLLPHCSNPVFVQAVAAQNARKLALDEIKQIDKQWMAAEDELPIQAELTKNACAAEIKKICGENTCLTEVFVMDNQGANVGQNALTSDYWQGDEPKWQNSFAGGKGGVDVGKNQLDKSTNQSIQQISLPVIDEQGNVIGAVCWGVAVEKL